jgi:hypothetical protein
MIDEVIDVRFGSFTSFPPSRRVRFTPRADIRLPAFMSTRPSQQPGRRSPSRLILEIDIGELLAGVVLHDKQASNSSSDHGGGKRRLGRCAMRFHFVRKSAWELWRLMASIAASLVPTIAPGFQDDVVIMSATKSSMSLTTTAYCLGDFIPPCAVTVPGLPDHSRLTPMEPRAGFGYRMSSCLSSLLIVLS